MWRFVSKNSKLLAHAVQAPFAAALASYFVVHGLYVSVDGKQFHLKPNYLIVCNRMTAQRLLAKPWVGEAVNTVLTTHFCMTFA